MGDSMGLNVPKELIDMDFSFMSLFYNVPEVMFGIYDVLMRGRERALRNPVLFLKNYNRLFNELTALESSSWWNIRYPLMFVYYLYGVGMEKKSINEIIEAFRDDVRKIYDENKDKIWSDSVKKVIDSLYYSFFLFMYPYIKHVVTDPVISDYDKKMFLENIIFIALKPRALRSAEEQYLILDFLSRNYQKLKDYFVWRVALSSNIRFNDLVREFKKYGLDIGIEKIGGFLFLVVTHKGKRYHYHINVDSFDHIVDFKFQNGSL